MDETTISLSISVDGYTYAPIWKRIFAWVIDTFLIVMLFGTITHYFLLDILINRYKPFSALIAVSIALLIQALIYTPFMQSNGGTIGERIMGIHSISLSTSTSPRFGQSFMKNFLFYWAVIIGLTMNGSLILYANAHNFSDEHNKSLFNQLMHPDQYSLQSYNVAEDIKYWKDKKSEFIYEEPETLNGFLMMMFYCSIIGLSLPALFRGTRQTVNDKLYKTIVLQKGTQGSIVVKNYSSIKMPNLIMPKFKISSFNTQFFSSRLAYLIYFVLAIILILYVKYKFDIMKEEKHYELKYQYEHSDDNQY